MAADDVYLAMLALEDDDVLDRAAAGDWSALGELELTDHEHELVQDLIDELAAPVCGFSGAASFAAASYTSGNVSPSLAKSVPAGPDFGGLSVGSCRRGCRRGCRYSCRRGCRRGCRRVL